MAPVRVAVIGGGPAGMFFCHAAEQQKRRGSRELKVTCFEAAPSPGGVWKASHGDKAAAVYDELWTNGPSHAIEFYDYHFDEHFAQSSSEEQKETASVKGSEPPRVPVYLPRRDVQEYITGRVTRDHPLFFDEYFEFGTRVEWVSYDDDAECFELALHHQPTGVRSTRTFDKCVWAAGENARGRIPTSLRALFDRGDDPEEDEEIANQENTNSGSGNRIETARPSGEKDDQKRSDTRFFGKALLLHSADTHRIRESVADRNVLLIGGGYSAEDLALQCLKWGADHVDISTRSEDSPVTWTTAWPGERVSVHTGVSVQSVVEDLEGCAVAFEKVEWVWPDGYQAVAGTEGFLSLSNIHLVIFCTGYRANLSMLDPSLRPAGNTIPGWSSGERSLPSDLLPNDWSMDPNNPAHAFTGDVAPGEGRMLRANYNHEDLHRGVLIRNPSMMFLCEHGSEAPLLSLDAHAWLLCSYLTGMKQMPSAQELRAANLAQVQDQFDVPYLRFYMDEGYQWALNELDYHEFWPHPDGTTKTCGWDDCETHYQNYALRLLVRVMEEGGYPGVSLGTYEELNHNGLALMDFNLRSYYTRSTLDGSTDAPQQRKDWKTFRDNPSQPEHIYSLYTGTQARPLTQPWMGARGIGCSIRNGNL